MEKIVLDSYALIAVFLDERGADFVGNVLVDGNAGRVQLCITSYNMGEVYYMIWRKASKAKADICWHAMLHLNFTIIEPGIDLTFSAAGLKAMYKLSYADAHAAALALQQGASLLTGDKELENLKKIKGFKLKFIV